MSFLNSRLQRLAQRYWCAQYAAVAGIAVAFDLMTKQGATWILNDRVMSAGDRLGFMLVYNQGGPGGVSYGPWTWHINVLVTAFAIVLISLIVREIGQFHRLGPYALGLVAGGALGNLLSMLFGPAGVADFLAVHLQDKSIVLNFADLALWSGALLLIPVIARLLLLLRAQRKRVVIQSF